MTRAARIRAQRQAALYAQDRAKRTEFVFKGEVYPLEFEPQEAISDEARRLARNGDPLSSHRAAQAIVKSGARKRQADVVLDALREWPGSTSKELASLSGLDRFMVARRLPDLEFENAVKRMDPHDGSDVRWWVVSKPVEEIRHPALSG